MYAVYGSIYVFVYVYSYILSIYSAVSFPSLYRDHIFS